MRTFLVMAVLVLVGAGIGRAAQGDVSLGAEWGENMVLQSGVKTVLQGAAARDTTVSIEFRGRTYRGKTNIYRTWNIEIETGPPGGPFAMTFKGRNTINLKNVRVADTRLGQILGEGMVLQRGGKAPVFGTSEPGVKVKVDFRGRSYTTTADGKGAWRVDVDPGKAGGPFPMKIAGKSAINLREVYVGEVWVCSGQSNMHYATHYSKDAGKLKLDPPNRLLRLQRFPEGSYKPDRPAMRFPGWRPADKKTVMNFSGTGYYFGAELQSRLKVPVGLIHSAYNATSIREWTAKWTLKGVKHGNIREGHLYRRQIRSIQPFAIRGVIWYQGEADAGGLRDLQGVGYHRRLAALVRGWRRDWGQGDFPFLYVQLARIGFGVKQTYGTELPNAKQRQVVGGWPRVRDQQRRALEMLPNTGMAVVYDLTTGNLHPPEKKEISERLALHARVLAYGEKLTASGPLVSGARRQGNSLIVTFNHAKGLAAKNGKDLRQFEAAGPDGKFVALTGKVDGQAVKLDVKGLNGVLTLRYAYRQWPDGNLVNGAGLPASPFVLRDVK